MKTTKITLTNDFHNTSATVIPQPITTGRFAGYYRISRATQRRLVRELCMPGCLCSGTFGLRGGEALTATIINEDADRSFILDLTCGH